VTRPLCHKVATVGTLQYSGGDLDKRPGAHGGIL